MTSQKDGASRLKKSRSQCGNKLATLPSNARVSKRPLLRPPIASQYSSADTPKVVYVSATTPFLSAVKRVEKLLRLADQRLVQSATTLAKPKPNQRGRRANMTTGSEAADEIGEIARTVEQLKDTRRAEEVCVKGTGRAIPKVMEIGLWFQQREAYAIRLRTSTVSGIDDVAYEREAHTEGTGMDEDCMDTTEDRETARNHSRVVKHEETAAADGTVAVSETRIRKMSVLEVWVSAA